MKYLWALRATITAIMASTALAMLSCAGPELPDPSLSPYDVVLIQLEALQQNDRPVNDHGIEVAWNFASPSNKENTGPLERFSLMVQNENFRPLLNNKAFEVRSHYQEETDAEFFIMIEDQQGVLYGFMVGLSLQKYPPYEGCWMIDSFIPMDLPGSNQPKMAMVACPADAQQPAVFQTLQTTPNPALHTTQWKPLRLPTVHLSSRSGMNLKTAG